ncbi:MAG: acyltransferase [Candidatus Thorarchaeota archaeon]
MKKGFLIINSVVTIGCLLIILLIINKMFYSIPWINIIYNLLIPSLSYVFYDINEYVYGVVLIAIVLFLLFYTIGYNLSKTRQLTGSILYIFSLLGIITVIFVVSNYAYIGILFDQQLALSSRLMLLILFMPIYFALSLILVPVNIDFYIFFKDLVKARKIWRHKRPEFEVVVKGKITYINIETDEFIFTPVPMLIIAKHLRSKGLSVSWFVRGAFNHLLSLITTYLIGWPRARNMLFRFMGMKIGKNCHISQKAHPDPLLPELIEFEDGSGCGIGVKLLTHNVMNVKHGSFSFGPIKIGENARIGAYSIIMPGVTIGKGSIIGAKSLVVDDIPPFSVAHGSPARVIRKLSDSEIEEIDKEYSIS